MSPKKNWNIDIAQKIKKYEDTFELDDMNQANDLSAIRQLATLEVNVERLQKALLNVDIVKEPKKASQIQTAIKDNLASWNVLQTELKINRKRRKMEGATHKTNPMLYIEWLKEQAPKFLNKRLKKIHCPVCGQLLGKYLIYIEDNSQAEPGSIDYEKDKRQPMKFSFQVQCWKCASGASVQDSEGKWVIAPPKEVIAEHTEKTVIEAEEEYEPVVTNTRPQDDDNGELDSSRPTEQSVMKMVKDYDSNASATRQSM